MTEEAPQDAPPPRYVSRPEAPPPATPLDAILRVGEVDRALYQAQRRRAQALQISAPQEARLGDAKRALDKLKDLAKTLTRETTKLEGEAKAKQAEIDKAQVNLNQAKTNEEFQLLTKTIASRKAELGDLETKVLESYEAQEKRAKDQKETEAKLKQHEGEVAEAKKRVAEELKKVEADVARLDAERKAAASAVGADHLAVYQRALEQNKDAAMAAVIKDICQGCFMKVRPDQVSQIRGKQLSTCFTCSRILYLPT